MLGQGFLRPARDAGVEVVAGGEVDEVAGQLAAHDELLQERVACGGRRIRAPGFQRNEKRRDLPEVQVGAQAGDIVGLGLVVVAVVARQPVRQETPQTGLRRAGSALEDGGDRCDVAVDLQLLQDGRRLVEIQAGKGHADRWRPHGVLGSATR